MTDEQIEDIIVRTLSIGWRFSKWYIFQYVLLFCMPFIWGGSLCTGTAVCIAIYTLFYSLYWEFVPVKKRLNGLYLPLVPYIVLAFPCCLIWSDYFPSLLIACLLPMYGAICFTVVKLSKRGLKKKNNTRTKRLTIAFSIMLVLIVSKMLSVSWGCKGHGSVEGEKKEILQRRDYLVETLAVSPSQVLDEMPSGIGEQFQGEWALYSCSMLSAALSNISSLYPETKEENLRNIDKLIQIVKSSELRKYDSDRWGEDPLSSLSGNQSHVSYLIHLAWMIGSYKAK